MDLRQLMSMALRIFMRKAVNHGINKGIDLAARRGKAPGAMTAAERAQAQGTRAAVKRARKAARIARRLGR